MTEQADDMTLGRKCEFSTVFRDQAYIDEYVKHYPKAEPEEEFYDRVRLYSLKGAINYSAGHPNSELRKTRVHHSQSLGLPFYANRYSQGVQQHVVSL